MAHHQLDELDEKILKLIIGNARMPSSKLHGSVMYRVQQYTNVYKNLPTWV